MIEFDWDLLIGFFSGALVYFLGYMQGSGMKLRIWKMALRIVDLEKTKDAIKNG